RFTYWVGTDWAHSPSVPLQSPEAKILRSGAAVNPPAPHFHVAVAGHLMAGRVPDRFIRLPTGQGGNGSGRPPIPLPRRTGEDILRVYIDLNSTDNIGFPFHGRCADHMVEVRGAAGRVTAQALYAWTGTWSPIASPTVALAKNDTDIEGSVAVGPITNTTRMAFAATDWGGIGDSSPLGGTLAASPPLPKLSGPVRLRDPGLIIYSGTNVLTAFATPIANQPTVDGNCDTSPGGEYDGADVKSNGNLIFHVGRRSQIFYVFVCVEVTADGT